jgi:predicted membrane chloride channel (bestrophin family)
LLLISLVQLFSIDTAQIRQLVFFYVFTLPLVLEYTYPTWISLAAIFMLSFGFFGIEEAGR